jgi:hypothetical protein
MLRQLSTAQSEYRRRARQPNADAQWASTQRLSALLRCLTRREDCPSTLIADWLIRHSAPVSSGLLMTPTGHRPADQVIGLYSCERKYIYAHRRATTAVPLGVGTTIAIVGTDVINDAHLKRQTGGRRGKECWCQCDPEPEEKRDHAVRCPNHHRAV